jgi:hypothetical protein
MSMGEFLSNIATGGAVFIGIVYIIGGMIVNLNLTRRGVVEYQILKVKFLAVGLIFLLHFLGVVLFAAIPVVLIATFAIDPTEEGALLVQALSIPSIVAAFILLFVWSLNSPSTSSFVAHWWFWFLLSVTATVFPLYVLLHQMLVPVTTFEWTLNTILGILVGALALMAMIYHYSSFYYGRPAGLGTLDPIGMGIPTRVDLLCDEKVSADLTDLGLPLKKNIIHNIYLIDETSEHYIVSQERVPGGEGNNQTYKIDKDLVKVILHKPDHMRKFSGKWRGSHRITK